MFKQLFTLLLLSMAGPAARAQSPWVAPPTAPSMTERGAAHYLKPTGPTTLWGFYTDHISAGPGTRAIANKVFRTADNGQTWQSLSAYHSYGRYGSTGYMYLDLSVVDDQNAWLLQGPSSSVLLRTTTGLTGFLPVAAPFPSAIRCIHFFSLTTGIGIATGSSATAPALFYRTTDGGLTWTQLLTNLPTLLTDEMGNTFSSFFSLRKQSVGTTLWLSTFLGKVLRTSDQGLTWTTTANVGDVAFEPDGLHGLASTGQQLSRTTDGGLSWTSVPFSGPPIKTMTAVPGLLGTYLSSNDGNSTFPSITAYISRDRGTSWQLFSASTPSVFSSMVATSTTQVWAGATRCCFPTPAVFQYTGTLLASKSVDQSLRLLASPNPTTGLVQLAGPLPHPAQVQVYDAAGRLCQHLTLSDRQRTLDLTPLPAGFYQVVISSPDGVQRHPILKQN